jgi:hypothetical protein
VAALCWLAWVLIPTAIGVYLWRDPSRWQSLVFWQTAAIGLAVVIALWRLGAWLSHAETRMTCEVFDPKPRRFERVPHAMRTMAVLCLAVALALVSMLTHPQTPIIENRLSPRASWLIILSLVFLWTLAAWLIASRRLFGWSLAFLLSAGSAGFLVWWWLDPTRADPALVLAKVRISPVEAAVLAAAAYLPFLILLAIGLRSPRAGVPVASSP